MPPVVGNAGRARDVRPPHPDRAGLEPRAAAVRAGAYDYVTKPIELDVLALARARAVQHLSLGRERRWLRTEAGEPPPPASIA